MSMIIHFRQHRPAYFTGFDEVNHQMKSIQDVLDLEFVNGFSKDRGFYSYAISEYHDNTLTLMALFDWDDRYNGCTRWWVIGFLESNNEMELKIELQKLGLKDWKSMRASHSGTCWHRKYLSVLDIMNNFTLSEEIRMKILHELGWKGDTNRGCAVHCDCGFQPEKFIEGVTDTKMQITLNPTNVERCHTTPNLFNEIMCKQHIDKIFVFGDNEERFGKGGQAVIRDCKNAKGIRTKKSPNTYWSDDTLEYNKACIDEDIQTILLSAYDDDLCIVLSQNGYGNGLARLPEMAPKTYQYLIERLNDAFGTNY